MGSRPSECRTQTSCAGTSDETKTTFVYDTSNTGMGNLLSKTVASGDGSLVATESYAYDLIGNVIAVDGPAPGNADTTYYRYDALRRPTARISPDPDGAGPLPRPVLKITYDGRGRVIRREEGSASGTSDAALQAMTVERREENIYSASDKLLRQTVSSGGATFSVTDYSYDVDNRLLCTAVRMNSATWGSATDACTQTVNSAPFDRITRNTYDDENRIITIVQGLGSPDVITYARYSYDVMGNQTSLIDANGNKASFTYDGHNRRSGWYFPDKVNTGAVSSTDYEAYGYDANGNRTMWRKRDGRVFGFTYDALNRLTIKTVPDGGAPAWATRDIYYAYDLQGHQTEARFDGPNGADAVLAAFDSLGRQTLSATVMGGAQRDFGYRYDEDGNLIELRHPDGTVIRYQRDGLDRLSQANLNGAPLFAPSYDAAGRVASLSRGVNGSWGLATSYSYDPIGRPSAMTHQLGGGLGSTWSFGYNPASQLTSVGRTNDLYAFTGYANVDRGYAVNGLNQYTSASGSTYGYDANGNLTSATTPEGSAAYGYDAENRLVTASNGVELRYDPLGRLWQVSGGAGGTQQFLYDGDQLTLEYDGQGNILRRYVHSLGDDDPLVWYEGAGTASPRYLYTNHQGSVIAVVDGQGNRLGVNSYDEYGLPGGDRFGRFLYTGQVYLRELDLYHYKARVYSPRLGRFLQTDPIGYEDQVNLYAYVANDPLNETDPSGECPTCIGGAAIGAGVDYGIQVAENLANGQSLGKALTNVNLTSIVTSAALGAFGNFGTSRLVTGALSRLPIAVKGRIGEAAARVGIALRGERIIASNRAAGRVAELTGRVSGRAARSRPDFVVRRLDGSVGVVEAKFGSSSLRAGQRQLRDQLGGAYRVSRTTAGQLGARAGEGAAAAQGASWSLMSNMCGFQNPTKC